MPTITTRIIAEKKRTLEPFARFNSVPIRGLISPSAFIFPSVSFFKYSGSSSSSLPFLKTETEPIAARAAAGPSQAQRRAPRNDKDFVRNQRVKNIGEATRKQREEQEDNHDHDRTKKMGQYQEDNSYYRDRDIGGINQSQSD